MGFLDFIFDPGKEDRERSNDLYQSSIGNQAALDQWKRDMMMGRSNLAHMMLMGKSPGQKVDLGPGVTDDTKDRYDEMGVTGAMPRAQDWTDRFFKFLDTSPDTTYNKQRTSFERGILDTQKSLDSMARRRGISNSGMALGNLRDLSMQRARGLSDLEGMRIDRQGERLSQGTQLANSLLDKILNMGNQSAGMAGGLSTQVPAMQSAFATSLANNAPSGAGIQNLIGQAAGSLFDRIFPSNTRTPPQAPPAGGIGQTIISMLPTMFGMG